ncbi:hypothetical protein ACQ4LK_25150, partial [Bacillus pumilus]
PPPPPPILQAEHGIPDHVEGLVGSEMCYKRQNMYDFFRKVSDAFYYPHDSKNTIKELVEEFLETEKKLIFK